MDEEILPNELHDLHTYFMYMCCLQGEKKYLTLFQGVINSKLTSSTSRPPVCISAIPHVQFQADCAINGDGILMDIHYKLRRNTALRHLHTHPYIYVYIYIIFRNGMHGYLLWAHLRSVATHKVWGQLTYLELLYNSVESFLKP